jgi:hypothetical protein
LTDAPVVDLSDRGIYPDLIWESSRICVAAIAIIQSRLSNRAYLGTMLK